MKACTYCGAKYPDDAVVCPIDSHSLNNLTEAEGEVGQSPPPKFLCPACGVADDYTPTVELRGSFSWLVFFAGGLLAVLFRNAGRRRKVRCNKCEALFEIHSPFSKVARVICWLLVCLTIITIVVLLLCLLISAFSH